MYSSFFFFSHIRLHTICALLTGVQTCALPIFPNPESRIPNPESRIPAYMNPIILTDIEGTTSSISFVKDVLFPYARQALPGFVRARGDEPEVRQWLDQVAMENGGVCHAEIGRAHV